MISSAPAIGGEVFKAPTAVLISSLITAHPPRGEGLLEADSSSHILLECLYEKDVDESLRVACKSSTSLSSRSSVRSSGSNEGRFLVVALLVCVDYVDGV